MAIDAVPVSFRTAAVRVSLKAINAKQNQPCPILTAGVSLKVIKAKQNPPCPFLLLRYKSVTTI